MDPAVFAVTDDERRRLDECSREAIRTPGMIQSHGVLMALDPETFTIEIVSENAAEWLGRHLAELDNPELEDAVRDGVALDPLQVTWDGRAHAAIVHRSGDLVVIELEQVPSGQEYARVAVVTALQELSQIDDLDELRRRTVQTMREITGFDRVMLYHFHGDGHGEVVAEDVSEELEPYLGLHFPASDIPQQARALYLTKIGRAIASTREPGIPLLSRADRQTPLDLTMAELRSVSPHHLEYMSNMGQHSTFSLSLIEDGRLAGMITCAHQSQRRLPVLMRRSLEVLAGLVARQMRAMHEIERLTHMVEIRERRRELLAPLYASDDISATLLAGSPSVLELVEADGAAIRLDGVWRLGGSSPRIGPLRRALELLGRRAFVSECIARERPELAEHLPGVAGLLLVPLGDQEDLLMFFRREAAHEIGWLGDPGMANRPDELSPRTSFSAWIQEVKDRSVPWGTIVQEAADLARELEDALARREATRLAELAMIDSLTGLHNRRYLEERLAAPGPVGPDGKAMLFIDLDAFKEVNDAHGHDVGDAVILEIAQRLQAHSRDQDDVIRLGGDEFVVLVDGIADADVEAIAERFVEAVAVPISTGAGEVTVTASCGVVLAPPGAARQGLLEAADAAMYRAKHAGRNRIST